MQAGPRTSAHTGRSSLGRQESEWPLYAAFGVGCCCRSGGQSGLDLEVRVVVDVLGLAFMGLTFGWFRPDLQNGCLLPETYVLVSRWRRRRQLDARWTYSAPAKRVIKAKNSETNLAFRSSNLLNYLLHQE
jgi:hypothetical protein